MPILRFPPANVRAFVGNRPYAAVVVVSGARRSTVISCLLDSGADYTVLPSTEITRVGLAVPATTITVSSVTGVATFPVFHGLGIEIEGIAITANVLIDTTGATRPILGRSDFMSAGVVGLRHARPDEWMFA